MQSSVNVIRVRWVGHVERKEKIEIYSRFWRGNLRERDQCDDLGVDGTIILKGILKNKWVPGLLPEDETAGAWRWPTAPIYSHSGTSWPVLGRTVPSVLKKESGRGWTGPYGLSTATSDTLLCGRLRVFGFRNRG